MNAEKNIFVKYIDTQVIKVFFTIMKKPRFIGIKKELIIAILVLSIILAITYS